MDGSKTQENAEALYTKQTQTQLRIAALHLLDIKTDVHKQAVKLP